MEPPPKPSLYFTILLVLLVALTSSGLVYALQKSQFDKQQSDLQAQIDTLNLALAKKNAPSPTPTPTIRPTATASPTPTALATPDPYAGWKSYTTKGLTFRYPADWTVSDTGENISLNSTKTYYLEGTEYPPIIFSIEKDSSSGSIDTYLSTTRAALRSILQDGHTTISGKRGYLLQGNLPPVYHDEVIVFSGGNVYTFANEIRNVSQDGVEINYLTQIFNNIVGTISLAN